MYCFLVKICCLGVCYYYYYCYYYHCYHLCGEIKILNTALCECDCVVIIIRINFYTSLIYHSTL